MSLFSISILLVFNALVVLLLGMFSKKEVDEKLAGGITLGTFLILVVGSLFRPMCNCLPEFMAKHMEVDMLAQYFIIFFLLGGLVVSGLLVMARDYLKLFTWEKKTGELYVLILIATVGLCWMAAAKDMVTMFLSLELVTVSAYVMIAYTRKNALAIEAGVKYLILGALTTGILVFGIAWIYGALGTMQWEEMAVKAVNTENKMILRVGIGLFLVAVFFKIGVAPFHSWVPDVYQGASTPVTAFLAIVSKASGFLILARIYGLFIEGDIGMLMQKAMLFAGSISVLLGALGAIFQTNLKRMLAYSGVVQAGMMVLALAIGSGAGYTDELLFYLSAYFFASVLAFLMMVWIKTQGLIEQYEDLVGLGRKYPLIGFAMLVVMASMAGIPLTMGFAGKFYVFLGLLEGGHWWAFGSAIVAAMLGFYYYFRPLLVIYQQEEGTNKIKSTQMSILLRGVLLAGILILISGGLLMNSYGAIFKFGSAVGVCTKR
jgi:NADH-quinone oxidoreductase subunit N